MDYVWRETKYAGEGARAIENGVESYFFRIGL